MFKHSAHILLLVLLFFFGHTQIFLTFNLNFFLFRHSYQVKFYTKQFVQNIFFFHISIAELNVGKWLVSFSQINVSFLVLISAKKKGKRKEDDDRGKIKMCMELTK